MYWLEISLMGATQPLRWHLNSTDANGKAPICSEGARSFSWQEALRNAEIPKNGNMIWRNYLDKENLPLDWRGAFLSTTSEDELSLHASSLGFVGYTQAAFNTATQIQEIGSLQSQTGNSAAWFRCSAEATHHRPDSLTECLQKTNKIIN